MYEHTPAPSIETFDVPDDTSDIRVRATQSVEEIARDIPELTERRESIAESLQEFMTSHEVDGSFLDDKLAGLVLCGVLDMLNQTADDDQEMHDFLRSSLVVLTQTHSTKLNDVYRAGGDMAAHVGDAEKLRAYEKYTNRQVTEAMKEAIDDGLLDAVKTRLGVDEEYEDSYELHVMNLSNDYGLYAFAPQVEAWNEALDYAENMKLLQQGDEDAYDVRQWKRGLERNADEFMKRTGQTHTPPAWVEKIDGKTIMAIPLPLAEKLLDGKDGVNALYDADDLSRDFAMLEHEYTHTQNIHMPEGSYTVGSLLEELRAEHFSEDMNGYIDLKAFARDFGVITGKDLISYIRPMQSKYETYTAIARDIGTKSMIELVLARSRAYTEHETNSFNQGIDAHIGGMEGVSARLLTHMVAKDEQAGRAIQARAEARVASKLKEITPEDYENSLEYMASAFGLHTMTSMYKKILEQKKTAEPLSV